MNADQTQPPGPDLTKGIDTTLLADGAMLLGHIGQDPVILARSGGEVFAIGATCTHYGGPLVEGLLVGDKVRCPWHHACFSLRTGEAVHAPALNPVACWSVETIDGETFCSRPPCIAIASGATVFRRHTCIDCHAGRWCSCGSRVGNTAARGIQRGYYSAQRGLGGTLRSAKYVKGFPRRHRKRGMDSVAGFGVLSGKRCRPPAWRTRNRDRYQRGLGADRRWATTYGSLSPASPKRRTASNFAPPC